MQAPSSDPPLLTASAAPLRVTHVITGLGCGGAETMLLRLVLATRELGLVHSIVSLIDGGVIASALQSEGVHVMSLGMREGAPTIGALPRLVRRLRRERPDVIQSWMYHADLLAGLAVVASGHVPLVWGIRQSDVDPLHSKRLTRFTRAACARLSGVLPDRIVCCAHSALQSHAAIGYRADRMVVIPNGFDLRRFTRDPTAGSKIRRDLSIDEDTLIVGMVARFHPDKDHPTFFDAAARVARASPRTVFVLAGDGVDWSNTALSARVEQSGLRARVRLLGRRADVPTLLSSMDVFALSSRTEAFPNVIGEAMSCSVPCVATDAGDAREIVGPTGRIVPTRNPSALADAILEMLALPSAERAALGAAAADRVRQRYDLEAVAHRYAQLYRDLAFTASTRSAGRGAETLPAKSIIRRAAPSMSRADSPLRVLHVTPTLNLGGAERMITTLSIQQRHSGHSVAVVSLFGPSETWLESELAASGVPVYFLGKRPGLDVRMIPRLASAVTRTRPDLLHTHMGVLKYALPAMAGSGVRPIVHTVHSLAQFEVERSSRALQYIAFRVGVSAVAIGDGVARSMRDVYRLEPSRIIPNGIVVAEFGPDAAARAEIRRALGISVEAPVFLTVGRLVFEKNQALLLRAFASERLKAAGAHLLIAGAGELLQELEQQANDLGLSSRVHFLGARRDVARVLAAADVFVLSSRTEGTPLSVMEAMASGKPVVATAVGCIPELVSERTGRLAPTGDAAALEAAMHEMASDRPAASAKGAAAACVARERFDVSVMVRAYDELYREVHRRRAAPARGT